MDLKIAGIQDVTDRIRLFELEMADGRTAPEFSAGAHLAFDLGDLGKRAYSLIRWPGGAGLHVAVQREDAGSGGSVAMHALQPGDTVSVDGPKNEFPLIDHAGSTVLLAGGIGITPLISMATELAAAGRDFTLYYAGRSRDAMGFVDALEAQFGTAVQVWCDDANPIDLEALGQDLPKQCHLYICGPRGMIDAARAAAEGAGLPPDQIHVELFENAATTQDGDAPFEVEIAGTGDVHPVGANQTIIEALEAAGVDLIYDCQRGDCGICQTDVIDGIPDHRDVVLSQAERDSNKVMQICVSRAKTPRLVLDL